MSDLFVFRCQKYSIGKLIFYAAVNIKFCIANFSTGIVKSSLLFHEKIEGSEIEGLKIFRSNSQASMVFITCTLLKCLLKMSS